MGRASSRRTIFPWRDRSPWPTAKPEIALFGAKVASELNRLTGGQPLEQQFETQIKRRLRPIDVDGAAVDVAFDEGFIFAGENTLPLSEVELELKSGEEGPLYDLAIKCTESLPIRLEPLSKAERGFLIAAGESPPPARATPLQFPRDATVDDAVTTVVGAALGHFLANWACPEPEALHGGCPSDACCFASASHPLHALQTRLALPRV
jgi:triphosphatase